MLLLQYVYLKTASEGVAYICIQEGTYQQLYSGNLEEKIVMMSIFLGEKKDRTWYDTVRKANRELPEVVSQKGLK